MLVSSKKAEIEKDVAFEQGRISYISRFLIWHQKLADEQLHLESVYNATTVPKFDVNVWDDYESGKTTYAYVEETEVPDTVCFELLSHLYRFAKSSSEILSTGVTLGFRYFDASEVWPKLIGSDEGEYSLFKRWEMTISGANYETLEFIVKHLQKVPSFDGKPLHVYSES